MFDQSNQTRPQPLPTLPVQRRTGRDGNLQDPLENQDARVQPTDPLTTAPPPVELSPGGTPSDDGEDARRQQHRGRDGKKETPGGPGPRLQPTGRQVPPRTPPPGGSGDHGPGTPQNGNDPGDSPLLRGVLQPSPKVQPKPDGSPLLRGVMNGPLPGPTTRQRPDGSDTPPVTPPTPQPQEETRDPRPEEGSGGDGTLTRERREPEPTLLEPPTETTPRDQAPNDGGTSGTSGTGDNGSPPVLTTPPNGGIGVGKDGFALDTTVASDPRAFLGSHPTFQAFQSGKLKGPAKDEVQKTIDAALTRVQTATDTTGAQLNSAKTGATQTEVQAKKSGEDEKSRATKLADQQKVGTQKQANADKTTATALGTKEENTARNANQQQVNLAQNTGNQQIQTRQRKLDQDKANTLSKAQAQGQALQNDAKAKGEAQQQKGERSLWDRAKDLASNTWESIKSAAGSLWEKATKMAKELMDKARNTIAQWSAQLNAWIAEKKAQIKAQIDQIKSSLAGIVNRIKSTVAAKWQEITTRLQNKWAEITKSLSETWERVKNKVSETVKNAWDTALAHGRALRDGLVNNVKGIWADVLGTIENIKDGGAGPTTEEELFLTPEERADWIWKAMRGFGTNEEMVLRCLNGSAEENAKVAAAFKAKYGMDLNEALKSELGGNDLSQANELLSTGKVSLGTRIERALEGWGADGDSIATMFEKATDEERKALLQDPKYAPLRARILAEGGPELLNRLASGADKDGKRVENEASLVAAINQRGAGWGTNEEGVYKDLTDFAKKNPELAKKLASDSNSALYKALASELSGRDLDKALGLLKGGGTRGVEDVLESEINRLGTDEDGIMKALQEMDPKERDAIKADPKRKAALLAKLRSELGDSDYTKATALFESGKQAGKDKIKEELAGWNTDDRVVLDAVIGMDAGERAALAKDTDTLARLKSGMGADNYARLCTILGVGLPKDAGTAKANNQRIATIIIDGADHWFDANEDQIYKIVLEAQTLAKKNPPEADLNEILELVRGSGKLSPQVPAYQRIYLALQGKRELSSTDRLKQATDGAGTDDAALTAMMDDLSGRDLLENWSNIAEYRRRKAAVEAALKSKDQASIAQTQRKLSEFILDVKPDVLARIRGDTDGKDRTEVLAKLRKKLRDAAAGDPEFKEALGATGLKISELDLEKMEYVQSQEEMDVHRREGSWYSPNDLFSSKGKQLDDSHGSYMGTLRTGIQDVKAGKTTEKEVVEKTNDKQSEFEERLQAYKDMKAFAANVIAAVVGTIVAVVTTILTGGGAAGFWAAVLAGAQAGAYSAIAAVAVKEVIQGGSYSVLEEGTAEIVLGAVCGAIGGGAKSAFGGSITLANMSKSVGTKLTNALKFLGPISEKIGGTAAGALPVLPETLVNNISSTTLNAMVNQEGFFRSGGEGIFETLTPQILNGVSKDMLASTMTQGILQFTGKGGGGLHGNAKGHAVEKMSEGVIENSTKLAYDFAMSEGRMSEEDIIKGLLSMTSETLITGAQSYHKASLMLDVLNTYSADRLVGYEGITPELAKKIVAFREQNGKFTRMEQLQKVPSIPDDVAEHVYYQRKKDPQKTPPPPDHDEQNTGSVSLKDEEQKKKTSTGQDDEEQKKLLPPPKDKTEDDGTQTKKSDKTDEQGTLLEQKKQPVTEQKKQAPLKQKSQDLDELYEHAKVAQEHLSQATKEIASAVGGEPMIPPSLKGRDRTLEKIQADYGGDASRITDLARSSIVCDTPEQVYEALSQIKSRFKVVREKDRFKEPVGGYRDMLLNLEMPNGHIVEVQLHLKGILEVKNGAGHHLYEQVRTIEANAKKQNRDLTPEELATVTALKKDMQQVYDDAYTGSIKPKTGSETDETKKTSVVDPTGTNKSSLPKPTTKHPDVQTMEAVLATNKPDLIKAHLAKLTSGGSDDALLEVAVALPQMMKSMTPEQIEIVGKHLFAEGHQLDALLRKGKKTGQKDGENQYTKLSESEQKKVEAQRDRSKLLGQGWSDELAKQGLDPFGNKIEQTLSITGEDWGKYKKHAKRVQSERGAWTDMDLPSTMWSYQGNIDRYSDTHVNLYGGENGVRIYGKNRDGSLKMNDDGTMSSSVTANEVESGKSVEFHGPGASKDGHGMKLDKGSKNGDQPGYNATAPEIKLGDQEQSLGWMYFMWQNKVAKGDPNPTK